MAHLGFVVTEVQHDDICYQRRSLYIVIIEEEEAEEEASRPRRCETLTASDAEAPGASARGAVSTMLLLTGQRLMEGKTSGTQPSADGGLNASLGESAWVCAACVTVTNNLSCWSLQPCGPSVPANTQTGLI